MRRSARRTARSSSEPRPTTALARFSGRAASRRSPPWAGSPPTTTCRTASFPERAFPRSCGGSRLSRPSTASASANVFHAGDGNLHPLVLYDGEQGETEKARDARRSNPRMRASTPAARSRASTASAWTRRARCRRCSRSATSHVFTRLRERLRPGGPLQSREGRPHAEALRRGPRSVSRPCAREDRPCRASLASRRPRRSWPRRPPRAARLRIGDDLTTDGARPDPRARGGRPHLHRGGRRPAVGR